MNHKRPTTYCNKTDKALCKALLYLEKLCLRTDMEENHHYQNLVLLIERSRDLLNTKVKDEANMHPQDWEQKNHVIVKVKNPKSGRIVTIDKTDGRIIDDTPKNRTIKNPPKPSKIPLSKIEKAVRDTHKDLEEVWSDE